MIGVIISLILLIMLAYKGWSVILIAPILEETYNTSFGAVGGTWALIIALITGIVLMVLFNRSRFEKGIVESLKEGANSSLLAIMNTASEVGYGN